MPPSPLEEAADKVGDAVEDAAREVGEAFEKAPAALEKAARGAASASMNALESGAEQVSRFGRLVLRAWKLFEKGANPPWTVAKTIGWACLFLVVAITTVLAYQIKFGILTLPIIEEAGGRFVAWMAALGAAGLFLFTAVGTLFFMVIPTEPFFFITLSGTTPVALAIAAAALGSAVGSFANYAIGNRLRVSAGKGHGDEKKLGKWGKRAHSKWGTAILFLASSTPTPELVAVAYGLADYPFKKFVLVVLPARIVKWSWVAAAFLFLSGPH